MTYSDRYLLSGSWKRRSRPDVAAGTATQPAAPTGLSSSAITDTTVTLTWTLSVSPGITEQRIYLGNSRYLTIANGTQNSVTITGLTANTAYLWRITAYNGTTTLNSPWSTAYSMTTTSAPPTGAPNTPGSVAAVQGTDAQTEIDVSWSAPATDGSHGAATGYRVYANGVQQGADLGAVTSHTLTGLYPGTAYTIAVSAFNATGESPLSSGIIVTTDSLGAVTMLMGCATTPNDHGGTEDWDGWRTYNRSSLYQYANRTASLRPLFMAYSAAGPNLGASGSPVATMDYTTIFNYCLSELNAFYYGNSAGTAGSGDASNTHSVRWGIALYWSNGNENFDKGTLTTHTQANIDAYTNISQKALYDACHYIDPSTGQRRFPDAYAGSNPTTFAEQQGEIEAWLHPSAKYHDFVMWSMYPPGRSSTVDDPTYNWPSFVESNRTNLQLGFMLRCYYRTYQAMLAARAALANPNFTLMIGCGEVGIGDDPSDSTTRPYYITNGLARAMYILSQQYGLPQPFACWWDQELTDGPQNILSDEAVGTNPSSRVAWQSWATLTHLTPYSNSKPASWTSKPSGAWKTTGTVL